MLPTLGLVRIGNRRWTVPLPLPVFLFWPFVLLALGGVSMSRGLIASREGEISKLAIAHTGLLCLFYLSGLTVDIHAKDGTRVLVWFW